MIRIRPTVIVGLCVMLGASARLESAEPDWWGVHFGLGNVLRQPAQVLDHDNKPWLLQMDYRFAANWWGVHPWVGGAITTRQSSLVGAGFVYHFDTAAPWRVSVGSSLCYFNEGRDGLWLGHHLEFFSFIEASRPLGEGRRLVVRFGHVSNASIGVRNPGSETLTVGVAWARPLRASAGSPASERAAWPWFPGRPGTDR